MRKKVGSDHLNFLINSAFLKTCPLNNMKLLLLCFVFTMTTSLLEDRKSSLGLHLGGCKAHHVGGEGEFSNMFYNDILRVILRS